MRYPHEITDPKERARALLLRQLYAFVRDVRHQPISSITRTIADELVATAEALHPDLRR